MDYEPTLRDLVKAIDSGNQSAIDEAMIKARQNLGLDNRRRVLKLLDAALDSTSYGGPIPLPLKGQVRYVLKEARGFIKSLLPESKLRALLTDDDVESIHNHARISAGLPSEILEKLYTKGGLPGELRREATTHGYEQKRADGGLRDANEYAWSAQYAIELSKILKDAEK